MLNDEEKTGRSEWLRISGAVTDPGDGRILLDFAALSHDPKFVEMIEKFERLQELVEANNL